MKQALLAAKLLWAGAMVALLGWYLWAHWSDFAASARNLGVVAIMLSVGALLLGKVVLAEISRLALTIFGVKIGLWLSFSIYSLSQLGKYLPGSIWHFVGKVMLYTANGLPARQGAKLLVLENYWLLGAAATVGVMGSFGRLLTLAGLERFAMPEIGIGVAFAVLVLWAVALWLGTRAFGHWTVKVEIPLPRIFLLGLLAWVLFGVSFWALLPAEHRVLATLPLASGAFALGWAGGYVAIFAPAGIGIREAIITVLLSELMLVPEAVAVAALSRLVWTVTEIVLGAPAAWCLGPAIDNFRDSKSVAGPTSATR